MSVGLIENVGKSFGYAVDNTLKKILRWIGLTIVMCIPIVNFIAMGLFLKVFRGEEPDFSNAGKSFIQGLLLFIISIIYMIIPIIAFAILGGASFITAIIAPEAATDAILAGGAGLGIIALFVLAIIFGLIMLPAEINFARKQSFGAAFKFGEIFGMIGKLGWGKYILAIILVYIIAIIFGFVVGLFALIPVVGIILTYLAIPFAIFFELKYYANLFE